MAVINPYNYNKPMAVGNFKMSAAASEKSEANKSRVVGINQAKYSNAQQDKYLEQKVMSAKPEELVMMLYEGLVKFIKFSLMYLEESNIEKLNESAQRAQAIVSQLQSTLNMDYEISKQLDSLYSFVYIKLTEGNVKKSKQSFDEALEISKLMLEMWNDLVKQMRSTSKVH